MRPLRLRIFYLFLLALFAALMYWLIGEGTRLENHRAIRQVPLLVDDWGETFLANFHHPFALLLVQIIVILSVTRCFGWLFQKIRQPAVVGEIMAGIVLGPSLVG